MKRRVLLVFSVLSILTGIFILVKVAASTLAPKGKGGLQVTSNVKANVFLDNKAIGETPVCLCEANQTIPQGKKDLKIVPDDKTLTPFSVKVDINPGVLTAVERTFLPGALASSYVLTLEKNKSQTPEVFIASIPNEALITIDGDSKGVTPYTDTTLPPSEHEVEITKPGFSKKTIRVRTVKSYRLVLNVTLGTDSGIDETDTITPTPKAVLTPTPTVLPQNSVTIKDTPTGFLRVRVNPSVNAEEIGRVNPGESYEYADENASWYQIKLKNGELGWISKTYATKSSQ
ncbi:MAG TPA: PEGA domain-containing protein [Patescibacteria group bacterium]|nr:PEGA domain-containing protein [Patescibacteria group bacterium]